jgi:hypothetical protein
MESMTGGRFDEPEPVPLEGPARGVACAVSLEASIAGAASCVELGLGGAEVESCGPLHAAAHALKTKAAVRSNARSMFKSLLLASVAPREDTRFANDPLIHSRRMDETEL